jgi:nucleoside-diphosphate-sugar epimerase
MKLLVLGLGYTAGRFVERHGEGFADIVATVRDGERAAALSRPGLTVLPYDGTDGDAALVEAAAGTTHVLVSIPPARGGAETGLSAVRAIAQAGSGVQWIGYLSTIGVYGDHDGAWIDEATPAIPAQPRSQARLHAENAWRDLADEVGARVQIFRLPGIYGPGRNALVDLRESKARSLAKAGQVFNRAHVDDIAAAIAAGIARPQIGPVINVADDEPAPQHEVVGYAADLLGVEPPPVVPFEEAEMSEMARSFWSENKRVRNARLRDELGVTLQYPTYRAGLRALYDEDRARGTEPRRR